MTGQRRWRPSGGLSSRPPSRVRVWPGSSKQGGAPSRCEWERGGGSVRDRTSLSLPSTHHVMPRHKQSHTQPSSHISSPTGCFGDASDVCLTLPHTLYHHLTHCVSPFTHYVMSHAGCPGDASDGSRVQDGAHQIQHHHRQEEECMKCDPLG